MTDNRTSKFDALRADKALYLRCAEEGINAAPITEEEAQRLMYLHYGVQVSHFGVNSLGQRLEHGKTASSEERAAVASRVAEIKAAQAAIGERNPEIQAKIDLLAKMAAGRAAKAAQREETDAEERAAKSETKAKALAVANQAHKAEVAKMLS